MSRDDPNSMLLEPRLFCDLTQSWSDVGGGVGTYLRHKRRHILDNTPHRHLMIIPGRARHGHRRGPGDHGDDWVAQGARQPALPADAAQRRGPRGTRAVPARLIECQDAYNLPWAAIGYRQRHPETALVAAYMTDFPTVYVERPFAR